MSIIIMISISKISLIKDKYFFNHIYSVLHFKDRASFRCFRNLRTDEDADGVADVLRRGGRNSRLGGDGQDGEQAVGGGQHRPRPRGLSVIRHAVLDDPRRQKTAHD